MAPMFPADGSFADDELQNRKRVDNYKKSAKLGHISGRFQLDWEQNVITRFRLSSDVTADTDDAILPASGSETRRGPKINRGVARTHPATPSSNTRT